MSNAKLIAELKRRANFPEDVPDRAFLVGIRHLLSSAVDALEESAWAEAKRYHEGFSAGFEAATGRKPKFGEIRSYPGVNGFPVSDA